MHAESERNRLGGGQHPSCPVSRQSTGCDPITTERAVAATLVLMDPAVHRTLMREHGWTRPEYASWIERTAMAELLRDTPKQA